jgi:hypothetical protein
LRDSKGGDMLDEITSEVAKTPNGIWKESILALYKNWRLVLVLGGGVACVNVATTFLTVDLVGKVLQWLAEVAIIYVGCGWVLSGVSGKPDVSGVGYIQRRDFCVRVVILYFLAAMPNQFFLLLYTGSFDWSYPLLADNSRAIASALIRWSSIWLVGALLITWLPAALRLDDDTGILHALQRGWKTIGYVVVQFLIGPTVLIVVKELCGVIFADVAIEALVASGGVGDGMYRLISVSALFAMFGVVFKLWWAMMVGIVAARAYIIARQDINLE